MESSTSPSLRRTRRWRVPPPLTRGRELLEGGAILSELQGETAVLLWKAARSVSLWGEADPREMEELFAPSAHARRLAEIAVAPLDPRVREPLETVTQVLADPLGTPREAVALACRRIAAWAEERDAPGTALAFQQAAALACPGDARHAYEVGRLARHNGERARAESWYRRAVMLGRQSGDWTAYARAYLGLGNLLMQRGSLPGARRMLLKGLRAARRHSLHPVAALAYHDLFMVCVDSSDHPAAARYARAAVRAYPAHHPRLPALANDIACFWMEQGGFRHALPVFQQVLPRIAGGDEHLVVLGNLARAAGGAGEVRVYEDAAALLLQEVANADATVGAAQGLLNLSRGGESLGRWDEAQQTARRALEIAAGCGAAQIVFQAEAVLDSIARARAGATVPAAQESWLDSPAEDELAGELLTALQSS